MFVFTTETIALTVETVVKAVVLAIRTVVSAVKEVVSAVKTIVLAVKTETIGRQGLQRLFPEYEAMYPHFERAAKENIKNLQDPEQLKAWGLNDEEAKNVAKNAKGVLGPPFLSVDSAESRPGGY